MNHNTQTRQYRCYVCSHTQDIVTNHVGETYSQCKSCKSTGMQCMEQEAIDERKEMPKGSALMHFYRYDISKANERKEYNWMKDTLIKDGLKMWDYTALPYGRTSAAIITMKENFDGKEVILYKPRTFDNQYISETGRLHTWSEAIYPNKDIKSGYYLTGINLDN